MRKLIGVVLIVVGIILTLSFFGRIMSFLQAIVGLTRVFSSIEDGYETGQILGGVFYWAVHLGLIFITLKYGSKLFKRKE
ncbi:MAG: hypothetical protein L3J14_05835 [Flavobacteriaceae bacterium]|nr:hypothetical protein [Flavobacteriaceae bacterium]